MTNAIEDTSSHILGSHVSSIFSVRKKSTSVDGKSVNYLERGSGIPVLFLHGFSTHKSTWRGVMARFPSDNYRLIAPDVPGYYIAQIDPKVKFSRNYFNQWIDAFVDSLGLEKFHLVAHSLSTMVGIFYGAARKQRLHSLILANAPDIFMPESTAKGGLVEDFLESIQVKSGDEWYQSVSRLFYRKPQIPRLIREYNYNVVAKNLDSADNFLEFILRLRPQVITNSTQLRCPVLLITSDHDVSASNGFAEKVISNFNSASTVNLIRCGHMSYLEKQSDYISGLYKHLESIHGNSRLMKDQYA